MKYQLSYSAYSNKMVSNLAVQSSKPYDAALECIVENKLGTDSLMLTIKIKGELSYSM